MRLTERFDVEHRLFLCQLDDVAELIYAGGDAEAWIAVSRSLGHALSLHMSLEERLLFPALSKARPDSAGLLAELAREHRAIEALARALPSDASGHQALDFIDAVRRHQEKETYVAFRMADEALPGTRLSMSTGTVRELPAPRYQRRGDWPECWLG